VLCLSFLLRAFQPGLTLGNVGQMSVDLLISTLGAERVGVLNPRYFAPFCGNDPIATGQGNIVTAAEGFAAFQANLSPPSPSFFVCLFACLFPFVTHTPWKKKLFSLLASCFISFYS
jgi:hypothetical protein